MTLTERDMGEMLLKQALLHLVCRASMERRPKAHERWYLVEGVHVHVTAIKVSRDNARGKGGGLGKNANALLSRARRPNKKPRRKARKAGKAFR